MKEIQLTQGKVALVDDEDFERVNQHSWRAKERHGLWYAYATISRASSEEGRRDVLMHRLITNAPPDKQIDHIDHDGLNNQRKNLRFSTQPQNQANRGKQRNNKSGFKGVSKTSAGTWQAVLRFDGQNYNIKVAKAPDEAARWYDRAARVVHGEFACLNFPAEPWVPTDQEWEYVLERLAPRKERNGSP